MLIPIPAAPRIIRPISLLAATLCACSPATATAQSPAGNPITQLVRLLNPRLVEIETRIDDLTRQLGHCAHHNVYPLKSAIGCRGSRSQPHAADPAITIDLGSLLPLDSIALVPMQPEFLGDPGIFPLGFTLEVSNQPDFAQRDVIFQTGPKKFTNPKGVPVSFKAAVSGRYLRLTVNEGRSQDGAIDLFGLSEIIAIAHGEPVSFGAKIRGEGLIDSNEWCNLQALADGRTPLGIWQQGKIPHANSGDAVACTTPADTTTWSIALNPAAPIDRIVLFPYQPARFQSRGLFPESITLYLLDSDGRPLRGPLDWRNEIAGCSQMAPIIFALHGQRAHTLRIQARQPSQVGQQLIHALSEIEVWSQGHNLAAGQSVQREHAAHSTRISTLTDGFSSEAKIIPIPLWLHQLEERARIENALVRLKLEQSQLLNNSELNTTWGASMVVGLIFLIPVFLVERRRLMSKDQLDQIRKRISADLHDDIGSNLGSISLIARTARKDLLRLQGPNPIAEDLSEMETIARESSLAMRDIVWLLERRQDSIGDLVQRMRETASRLLREIEFTIDCSSQKTAVKLSLNAKRHMFLFYKESIHNILKHSQATRVTIRLWDEGDQLMLEITDNGVGIPMRENDCPAAVHKLTDRARVLNGVLKITSTQESGTQIRLAVKRSHLIHSSMS